MPRGFRPSRGLLLFVLRNGLLYFLLVNAYLYLRGELSLAFLSGGFVLAALLAVLMERLRLRFWVALPLFLGAALGLRSLFFLVFRLQAAVAPGPDTDFLFLLFDKDFVPGLLPWALAWAANFLALRYPRFVRVETLGLGLLVLGVFWAQGRYRITLYPHPSLLAYALFAFLLVQLVVLMLSREETLSWRRELATLASFAWLALPVLLLLMLFILGRFNEGAVRLGGGLMKPTLFRFDFSEYVRLESEIEMSDDLVLLLRKEGPAEKILLRRYILSGYEKRRGFYHVTLPGAEGLPATVPDAPEEYPDPGFARRGAVNQEYYFVNFDPTSLVGMNYPVRVAPLVNWDASSFLRIYRVQSRVSRATAAELASARPRPLEASLLRHYTDYGGDERIHALAREITAGLEEASTWEKARRIQSYLKERYTYSLRPGIAADGDQLSHFLYESRKGYCSYFAFAMALLCRSLGIPARVAVGFTVDPSTEVLNFYEVRAFQAHAWVEVYFGEYGWIELDPSSETIAPGEEETVRFGFDFARFARLLEEILRNQGRLAEAAAQTPGLQERVRLWSRELLQGLLWAARLSYLILPALYLLVLGLLKGLPQLQVLTARTPRQKTRRLFRASLQALRGLGLDRRPEESWLEHADRLDRVHALDLRPWTESFLQAVFGPAFGDDDWREARRRHGLFRAALRRSFPPLRRALAFLTPLSPGLALPRPGSRR